MRSISHVTAQTISGTRRDYFFCTSEKESVFCAEKHIFLQTIFKAVHMFKKYWHPIVFCTSPMFTVCCMQIITMHVSMVIGGKNAQVYSLYKDTHC